MLARKIAHIVHDDKRQNLTSFFCNLQSLSHDIRIVMRFHILVCYFLMYDKNIKFKNYLIRNMDERKFCVTL